MKKNFFIFMVIPFVFTLTLEPFVVMNDIVPVFPVEDQDKIEGAVIEGAIHFLQAKSNAVLILQEVEKSNEHGMSYSLILEYVEKTISELEISKREFMKSIAAGNRAGYVEEIILKFKAFDYAKFESEKDLNNDLMFSVKSYLSVGNILGAYQENVDNICEILSTLRLIKEKIEINTTPDISLFWQLLHQFSKAALFGNYCTMIASAVLQ